MWGLCDTHGSAGIDAGAFPGIVWVAAAGQGSSLHWVVVASALVGGDFRSVVGGVMMPEEFCLLTASPVEKVAGPLMLLLVGRFNPRERRNKKQSDNPLDVGGGEGIGLHKTDGKSH